MQILSKNKYKKNKHARHVKKMLKYLKRLKQLKLLHVDGNFNCYRTSGKPCSCYLCSPYKYKRNIKHKNKLYE